MAEDFNVLSICNCCERSRAKVSLDRRGRLKQQGAVYPRNGFVSQSAVGYVVSSRISLSGMGEQEQEKISAERQARQTGT
jgi:hypothetical protein